MNIEREDLNPCTVLLKVKCAPEQVAAGFATAYKKAAKRIKVPGFRPGTAPPHLVRQYVDPDWVKEVAAEEIVKAAYTDAVKDQNLQPHAAPRIEITKYEGEEGELEFSAKVPLPPQIELGPIEGIEVTRFKVDVSDEEVEHGIQELREGKATRKTVESRGAQEGDFAVVNIKVDGDEGEGRNFMTVVGQTFPQLDQTLTGMDLDAIKHAELQFPDNFQEADWAGKLLSCQVRLRSLSAPVLPELTDEFAQQFNTESLEDLRERVREGIREAKERHADSYVHEQILAALLQSSTIHAPDPMIEGVFEVRMRDLAKAAADAGVTIAEVAKQSNMTEEELAQRIMEDATAEVHRALILTEIFGKLEMKIDKTDLMDQVRDIARHEGIAPEQAWAAIRGAGRTDELHFRALRKKVLEYLAEKAKVKIVDPPTE